MGAGRGAGARGRLSPRWEMCLSCRRCPRRVRTSPRSPQSLPSLGLSLDGVFPDALPTPHPAGGRCGALPAESISAAAFASSPRDSLALSGRPQRALRHYLKSFQLSQMLEIVKNALGWERWRDAADGAGCSLRPPWGGSAPLPPPVPGGCEPLRCAAASSAERLLLISGFDPVARASWKRLSSWFFF